MLYIPFGLLYTNRTNIAARCFPFVRFLMFYRGEAFVFYFGLQSTATTPLALALLVVIRYPWCIQDIISGEKVIYGIKDQLACIGYHKQLSQIM